MKTVIAILALSFTFASAFAQAEDYSATAVIDSRSRSIASESMALDVSQVRDRPFTVQVASHLNELNAIEHVERLKNEGFSAFYYPNFVKNQVLFKVCTGRFANEKEADAHRAELVKATSENLSVVASLLSRPGSDAVATQALLKGIKKAEKEADADYRADVKKERAESMKINQNRAIASVVATAATVASEAGNKVYSLQVAAFPNEELAKENVKKAEKEVKGYEVFYRPAQVDGKTWYRLFIGRFNEYQAANDAKKSMPTEKYPSPIVRKLFE